MPKVSVTGLTQPVKLKPVKSTENPVSAAEKRMQQHHAQQSQVGQQPPAQHTAAATTEQPKPQAVKSDETRAEQHRAAGERRMLAHHAKQVQQMPLQRRQNELRAAAQTTYGDLSGKTAGQLYLSAVGNTPGTRTSSGLTDAQSRLNVMYAQQVQPLYAEYGKKLEGYKAGKITAEELEAARQSYAVAYNSYAPMQQAYEELLRGRSAQSLDGMSTEELREYAEHWDVAGAAASQIAERSREALSNAARAYSQALTAYQAKPTNATLAALNDAMLSYSEAEGRYNADRFVLQEISGILDTTGAQYGVTAQREKDAYYDAHPYLLREEDTSESVAARAQTAKDALDKAKAEWEAATERFTPGGKGSFGVRSLPTEAERAQMADTRAAYEAAQQLYDQVNALNEWASDPAHLESRDEWMKNGWSWNDRFAEYQNTKNEGILDDLVYGFGAFMADEEQREELVGLLEQEFKDARHGRRMASATPQTYDEAAYAEADDRYRKLQDMLHAEGKVATSAGDIADAAFWTTVSDFASIGSWVLDAVRPAIQPLAPDAARWMQAVSEDVKADRKWAQQQMADATANMSPAAGMAIQLAPSLIEAYGSAWFAKLLYGAKTVGTTSALEGIAQYELAGEKASNWARTLQATMKDMAQNPQYWTSFARTAGTDYVDAVNSGASRERAMAYSLTDGSLNALIEIGGGGIQSLPRVADTLEDPTFRKALREVYLKSAFEEGMEEVYQGIVERGLSAVMLGSGNKLAGATGSAEDREAIFSLVSALEEFLGGAAIGAIVGLPEGISSMREGAQREQQLRQLNTLNASLPEGQRMTPLNVQSCTNAEVQDFAAALGLKLAAAREQGDKSINTVTQTAAAQNPVEAAQAMVETANPDKAVLNPIASVLQEKGYGDATGAQEQAELMGRVLDGEELTEGEVRRLDLNNDVVRGVFRERTGLTGMPETGTLDLAARKTYAAKAAENARAVKESQTELAAAAAQQVSAFQRKAQKAARESDVRRREAELRQQNQRQRPINTEGKTTDEVIRLVRRQSGSDQILTREEFDARYPAPLTQAGNAEAEALTRLEQAGRYRQYLTDDLGLTEAEADAVIRSQRLTDGAFEAYTESENVKEEENHGGREAGSDVEGARGAGGPDGTHGHDGRGRAENEVAGGAVPGSESVRGADEEGSVDGSDAARETSDGRVTFSEAAEVLENRYHNERIKEWKDAPVSQLSEAEASAFAEARAWVEQLTGAKVYLLNTNGNGVLLDAKENAKIEQNGKAVKAPPPIARGEFDTTGGVMRILVAADLTHTIGFSPARILTHEGLHALVATFGRKELRGKLRAKVMSNMTLLKGYNAFKASPDGAPYVGAYKGREDVVYEEYAAKVFAHQYGTEAEQKLIAEFVRDNLPNFPIKEYTKQMKALDELYAAPKTVEQAIEKKPAPPEVLPAPAPKALPAKQESAPTQPRASKAAREVAERFNVDLTQVKGTGKNGGITKADVQRYRAAQDTASNTTPADETKPIRVKPNTEKSQEAEPEAPKPIRVRPNTPEWRNETVPAGLTREQAKRIPEELRPAATPEERLDRFAHDMLGPDSGRAVAPETALQGDAPAAKEARRLYNMTNADIVFVTGEGDARSNRYIRNGSPDVRLREGWSFVTVSKNPEVMLQRVAKAIFDQLSVQAGTPTGKSKGIAKPNDMALVERVFHQIRLSGATEAEIAAIHKSAADAYAQQAKENGNLHDNWRNVYSTGALDAGDRIAELRALPESELDAGKKAELEWLEAREALLAQATEEEFRQLRESEDQIVNYGGEEGSKPIGQVLDRKAEATMQTNFQNWADYQYIRGLYAKRSARAAMDEQARKDFDVTQEGVHARLVYNALNTLYSKNKERSALWARRKAGESKAFQQIEARQTAQLRQWCADNLWTQEPQFGRPGKDYGLVLEQLRELFTNAQKRGTAVAEYRTELKNERDRAAVLRRALNSYETSDVYTLSAEAEAETFAADAELAAERGARKLAEGFDRIEAELRGEEDTSAYLETEEFGALLAEEREKRSIPPKPTDAKELYRWEQKYEALDGKAFLAAELRYRDLYGSAETQMSGEEMQAELTRSYARLRELDGQLTAAEKALNNMLPSWTVQLGVPAGASRYTVSSLARGVAAGQISAEGALEAVRYVPRWWRADNTLTAEDVLNRAHVDYAMTPVEAGVEVTETALHDLVEAAEDGTEAEGRKLTEQQNELLNAVAEMQQTVNPANEERAEMVRELKERGATPLNAPVGYTEKTRAYHHDPNGPRKVRKFTTTGDTAARAIFNDPYAKKAKERPTRAAIKEGAQKAKDVANLAVYSDVWGVERFGFKQTREDNVGVLINTVRGSTEAAGFIFTKGLVTPEGQIVGKPFRDAMLVLDRKGKLDVERQTKLDHYRQLLHTVDRMSIVKRAEASVEEYLALYPELKAVSGKKLADTARINPVAAEYARRLEWLKNAEDKPVLRADEVDSNGDFKVVSAATAQKLADEMLAKDPWLEAKAQETYEWWDTFMRLYVVGGTVSEADYNNLRAAYPHYVPTHREDMPGPLAKEFQRAITDWSESITAGPGLKKAKGSTKDIRGIPDQQAILVATYIKSYRVRELCNNIIDELLVDDAGNFREFGHIVWEKTDPLYKEAHEDAAGADGAVVKKSEEGHYLLTTFRNGKRITAELSQFMFTSLKNLLGLQADWYKNALRVGHAATGLMKAAITGANPNFALRNLAGDVPTALINTKNKDSQYAKAWLNAWEHIMRNSDEWLTFQALGGTHSNYMHLDKGFVKAATKGRSLGGRIVDVIATPGEISESVTRFAEYLATQRTRGDSYTNRLIGVHRSAEVTVDFGRAGTVTRLLNAICPYFNPAVQGIAKVFRSVFEEKSVKSAIHTLGRAAATSLLPELFMLLWRKLAGREEEFNEVSDYVKDNYYLIPLDEHKWFRVRKNRAWAAVFGNVLMRLFESESGYENAFDTYFGISLKGNFLPDAPIPVVLQQLLQLAGNENYAGSVIIPSSMDDFKENRPMAVYDDDTSYLAYCVAYIGSRVLKQLNPMAVDYLLHSLFGDFWSNMYDFFTMSDAERIKENGFDFLELAEDSLLSFWDEEKKAWVTDSRYSSSTVTRYYEMYGDLKANVAADKYLNGGATGSLEEEVLAALSNQRHGYSAQIQALSKEARSLPDGKEKAEIKGQIAVLAGLANDFYERCMAGEISDPVRYIKYHRFGSVVCDELVRLGEAEDGYDPESFNFDPTFSCPAYLRDPSNSDKQYTLSGNEELREKFIALQEENYGEAVEKLVLSDSYQKLSKSAQAAALEQQRSIVLAETKEEFIEYLKQRGVKSTDRTLASVELAQLEAKYALQRANSPDTAVSEEVSGELVRLESYASEYSFVLSTSIPATFRDQTDSKQVYTLTAQQQDYYDRERSALYNEALTTVIASDKYRKASDEEKAAMLEAAGKVVNKQLRSEFQSYLDRTGASSKPRTTLDDELIAEAAGYMVTEILSPEDAYDKAVTDELLRLYPYSDEYSFQPPTNKPTEYVDPEDKTKSYKLTEAQQEAYVQLSREVYNDAVQTVMADPSYAQLSDAAKARRLAAMRSKLSAEVKERFMLWLAQNSTSTDREDNLISKELTHYITGLLGW